MYSDIISRIFVSPLPEYGFKRIDISIQVPPGLHSRIRKFFQLAQVANGGYGIALLRFAVEPGNLGNLQTYVECDESVIVQS
jgi:hypothetical protein